MPAVNNWLDALIASAADGRGAIKAPVRVATTAPITLSGTQRVDGVTLAVGDHVLAKDQSAAAENGIWTVSTGGWTRRADADAAGELYAGATVYVAAGTAHGKTWWSLTTTGTIAVGATAQTWEELITSSVSAVPSSRLVTAGAGLTGGGSLAADRTIDVVAGDASIVVAADSIAVGVISDAQHGTRGGGTTHAAATTVAAGFMSAADKTLIDDGGPWDPLYAGESGPGDPDEPTAGKLRVSSATTADIVARAGSAQATVAACTAGPTMTYGTDASSIVVDAVDDITIDVGGASAFYADSVETRLDYGGSAFVSCSGSQVTLSEPDLRWASGVTPTLGQMPRTGDALPADLTITSQAPWASATGGNRTPGKLILAVPSPAGAGTGSYVRVDIDTTDNHRVERNGLHIARHITSGGCFIGGLSDSAASGFAAMYLGPKASTRGASDYTMFASGFDAGLSAPDATGTLSLRLAGVTQFYLSASGGVTTYRMSDAAADVLTFACDATGASTCTIAQGVTSWTLQQSTRTSDAACYDLTIAPQYPFASATTDATKKPGDLVIALDRPAASGTLAAGVKTRWGSSSPPTRREHAAPGTQTTDATTTTIGYLTLEEGSTHAMIVRAMGKVVATGVVLIEEWSVSAKRAGAGAVVESALRISTAGAGAWTIAFDASGNDVRCRATGAGGTTIEWDVHFDSFYRVRT